MHGNQSWKILTKKACFLIPVAEWVSDLQTAVTWKTGREKTKLKINLQKDWEGKGSKKNKQTRLLMWKEYILPQPAKKHKTLKKNHQPH